MSIEFFIHAIEIISVSKNSGQQEFTPQPPKELIEKYKSLPSCLGKYLMLAETEDIYITRNGKVVAKISTEEFLTL